MSKSQKSSMLDSIDQRTRLVGKNRLELLLFRLETGPTYAINVFKVQEVQAMLPITQVPDSLPQVVGVVMVRGESLPVIDLGLAIGSEPIADRESAKLIITEYNHSIQAFMVKSVERILNLNWEDVRMPPARAGVAHYLTAVANYGDDLLEVLDVERVLSEFRDTTGMEVDSDSIDDYVLALAKDQRVLVVDDSVVARSQVVSVLSAFGLTVFTANNGAEALALLQQWAEEHGQVSEYLLMMVTDAEMPELDGYSLASACRDNDKLRDLYIIMHTSLSENLNRAMVEQSGCDEFLSKYHPEKLCEVVETRILQRAKQEAAL